METAIVQKYIPESEASTYVGMPRQLTISEESGFNVMKLHDGITPGGDILNDVVVKTEKTNSATSKSAGYYKMYYSGPAYTGGDVPYMLTQAWGNINGTERFLGYFGFKQVNSANANCGWVIATRDAVNSNPVERYSIDGTGAHAFTGAMTYNGNVTFLGGSNTTTFTGNAYMLNVLNVGTSTSAGSILLFEERPIRFGGSNLQIRSKTGDNTTMVLEAINSRNIELKSANTLLVHLKSNGKLSLPALPTYADDTAAGSGGLVAGEVYKTSAGALMVKL